MKSTNIYGVFAWLFLLAIILQETTATAINMKAPSIPLKKHSMNRFRKLEDNTVENTAVGIQPVSNVEIINENTDNTDNTDNESSTIVEDAEKTEAIPTDTEDPQKNEAITTDTEDPASISNSEETTITTPSQSTVKETTATNEASETTTPVNSNTMSQALATAQRQQQQLNGDDKDVPLLRSFKCDRTTVSVITTKSSLRCIAEAFDEGSGVEYIYGAFYNTQGTKKIPFYFSEKSKQYTDPKTMISTFAMDIPIPQGIDNGIWTLGIDGSSPTRFINLEVGDYEGNVHTLTKEDIRVLGDSIQLNLTILSDPNPSYFLSPTRLISDGPIVKAIYCQEDTIDLQSSIVFRCFARIKPDNFGVKRADAVFVGPNGNSKIPFVFDGEKGFLREESDGTITLFAEQYVPSYIDSGKYDIQTEGAFRVTATSNAGTLKPARADDIEYAPSLMITSNTRDILAPEIVSFKCDEGSEKSLELPEKEGELVGLTCSLDAVDRVSGIQRIVFEFVDPSKKNVIAFSYAPPARGLNYNHELYNDLRLKDKDTVYFDKDTRRGAYVLRGATVTDNAGNTKHYLTSQLNSEYIQTYFMVDVPSELLPSEGSIKSVTSPASKVIYSKYVAIAAFLGGITFQMFMSF